ncbi:helix-turn-helix domain-containing protein [Bacillus paranthracis]|uniref:Helix-turn-helix transcriptional regulator n=1 Tax=Bacillus paranthracis TaxID=2026186 RepID=A0AAJ1NCF0_9BACI|nr:helix-turn-helix transcriptional regulator [Bacillus paranthracis]MDG0946662.1 helix-turn-helix transcriptional regulator [Bacillus paranthracis]MDG0952605.1 helix-turn-helix transcriptional regulator [Bacillus paranthracis]
MNLGERLKACREKSGYTQTYITEKLEIHRGSLSSYESGRRKPDYDTLSKLADIYKVSVDYLLGRSTNERLTAEQDKQATEMGKKIEELISKLSEEEQRKAWEQLEMYVQYQQNKESK